MVGTMKAKIDAAKEKAAATIMIKVGKSVKSVEDPEMAERLNRGLRLNLDGKSLDAGLKEIKDFVSSIAHAHLGQSGTVTFKTESVVCKVTFGYECAVPEKNVAELRRVLGVERFNDMIREKTSWTGNSALIELAADADNGKAVRKLVVIREKSPSISFSAVEEKEAS